MRLGEGAKVLNKLAPVWRVTFLEARRKNEFELRSAPRRTINAVANLPSLELTSTLASAPALPLHY